MKIITSEYKVRKVKNGITQFGEIKLTIELIENNTLEIIENYNGKGFHSQGYIEILPKKGYDTWKKGISNGIKYAYSKIKSNTRLKVIIEEASGLSTDTNPTIIGFAASRALLSKFENNESEQKLAELEFFVTSSWKYDLDSIPDFESVK
ncbi:hypothetical protein GCM10009430_37670 [Aquimarina litoralis]|uniref:Uncharacterized protein n=1 Tax=Aquimarina litoralis TaxID=584605 RepID=A0ABN1J4G1_9FLAO